MRCFLAARSASEIAFNIASSDFFRPEADPPLAEFLAILIATSRLVRIFLLTVSFLFDDLRARLAVLVTGTIVSILKTI